MSCAKSSWFDLKIGLGLIKNVVLGRHFSNQNLQTNIGQNFNVLCNSVKLKKRKNFTCCVSMQSVILIFKDVHEENLSVNCKTMSHEVIPRIWQQLPKVGCCLVPWYLEQLPKFEAFSVRKDLRMSILNDGGREFFEMKKQESLLQILWVNFNAYWQDMNTERIIRISPVFR